MSRQPDKNTCNILHLSDLHFGFDPDKVDEKVRYAKFYKQVYDQDVREQLLEKLIDAIRRLDENWQPDIVVFSGDIAWSGQKEEYDNFKNNFLEKLLHELELPEDRVIVVPGNHDIIRDKVVRRDGKHRVARPKKGISSIHDVNILPIDDEYVNDYWTNFGYFVRAFYSSGDDKHPYFEKISRVETPLEWPWLHFLVLNSAWDCRSDTDAGCLRVGRELMQKQKAELKEMSKADVRVAVLHHPYGSVVDYVDDELEPICWLHKDEQYLKDKTCFVKILEQTADIVLSGHVHNKDAVYNNNSVRPFKFVSGTFFADEGTICHCRIIKITKGLREYSPPFRDLIADPKSSSTKWTVTEPQYLPPGAGEDTRTQENITEAFRTIIKDLNESFDDYHIEKLQSLYVDYLEVSVSETESLDVPFTSQSFRKFENIFGKVISGNSPSDAISAISEWINTRRMSVTNTYGR